MQNTFANTMYIDGEVVDQGIENLLFGILECRKGDKFPRNLDYEFQTIVAHYLHLPPTFVLSSYTPLGVGALPRLLNIGYDFALVNPNSVEWPDFGFEHMPDAAVGCLLMNEGEYVTDVTPGRGVNQAVIAALVQYCRECAWEQNNQKEFHFH